MFQPLFSITAKVANALMRIEAAKQAVTDLPITPRVQARLRETARLLSTHYSTQIEGNRLTLEQAARVVRQAEHFPGRQRDEEEVLCYFGAIDELERLAAKRSPISERAIQTLHALVMHKSGKRRVKPTPYRDGQNVIRDGRTGRIVYLPPEAKDVPALMAELVSWLAASETQNLPCPLKAAVAHYQFATIHPYFDGNGRTARLLATLVLHLDGYDLKGLYSLEEYYARDLSAYYRAISVGPSHNYYFGRATSDISSWIEYFCAGAADAFESVQRRAREEARSATSDRSSELRRLDARQRRALELFFEHEEIATAQVGALLGLKPRTARDLCQRWVREGFLVIADPSKKKRKYRLHPHLNELL